ncbi:unnamed protein product [Leuciscus chuanchicus]
MVTVSSAQPSAPKSIFALSQCSAGSDGFLTVGCLTRGFSPADSLTFKWKDTTKDLDTFVQYPAFGSDGDYTKISHMRVKKSDWNPQNPYTCEASNSKGTLSTKVAPPAAPPPDQRATVFLTVPTIKELENGTATFSCLARQFSPKKYSFKWFLDGKEVTNAIDTHETSEKNASVTLYSATSIFKISVYKWTNTDVKVKCEFDHKTGKEVREAQYTDKLTLTLKPPAERELFINNTVVLEAVVSGDVKTVQEASVSCEVNSVKVRMEPGNFIFSNDKKPHRFEVDYHKWFKGETVTCTIRDRDIKQMIRLDKGDGQKPTVTIYRPDVYKDSVSLVCEVTSHKLGDVYIMWRVGEQPYIEANTSAPIHQKSSTSVLSILTMSKTKYESPETTITCAVKHANMENTRAPLEVSTSKSKQPECVY